MTQLSREYEAEETDSGDDMCGQIVKMQIAKVPRKCRTIRGELCLPCLEAMLITAQFESEVRRLLDTPSDRRKHLIRALLPKLWNVENAPRGQAKAAEALNQKSLPQA
ncbi:hypothetical protein PMG11_01654 [Penicillium brasilianum]|uniref:Uncharacterized protein n=1 Tax=Penicillium brasilianum TaxID=104259 RepID=A0A0F7THK4_PENBI|nr:hypothetical protein PMG11_01654 [Penicillium brasilianum]